MWYQCPGPCVFQRKCVPRPRCAQSHSQGAAAAFLPRLRDAYAAPLPTLHHCVALWPAALRHRCPPLGHAARGMGACDTVACSTGASGGI